jgi:hypothetical protein
VLNASLFTHGYAAAACSDGVGSHLPPRIGCASRRRVPYTSSKAELRDDDERLAARGNGSFMRSTTLLTTVAGYA